MHNLRKPGMRKRRPFFRLNYVMKLGARIREQDEMMMRNENFVRLNFRPLPLSIHPDASGPNGATAPDVAEVNSEPASAQRSREN